MNEHSFEEYIRFLKENLGNLIDYQEQIGTLNPILRKVKKDLFDKDPFIVFGASLKASEAFADKKLYH